MKLTTTGSIVGCISQECFESCTASITKSRQPTVFTSFAFHPFEAFLQLAFFPLIMLLIPSHYIALFIVFTMMSVSAVINLSGVEVFRSRVLLNHVISSTYHDRHHTHFNYNFGLYFNLVGQVDENRKN